MAEHLNEVVLQSLLAALVVEALLRLWEVGSPHLRLACRSFAFVAPLVLLPLFELLAPFRHADWFADGPALIATRHLAAFSVGGIGVDRLWPWPVWALGVLLLSRDLGPLLARGSRPRGLAGEVDTSRVEALVQSLAVTAGVKPPRVTVVDAPGPVLLCVGVWRPRLLVSARLFALLDEGELRAAVAHELSHVRRHDVLASWVMLGLRVVQAFNPVAQVLGRSLAWETELRADADAARWTGRPATLASALLKVFGTPGPPALGALGLTARLQRARVFGLEARCRLLLAPPEDPSLAPGPGLLAAAALGLVTLLFFVT
ncbi:MAG: M56 family metallopeptidase [Archangium sp.]|nr:M56 family metallopeptidase [Archangium sp.]